MTTGFRDELCNNDRGPVGGITPDIAFRMDAGILEGAMFSGLFEGPEAGRAICLGSTGTKVGENGATSFFTSTKDLGPVGIAPVPPKLCDAGGLGEGSKEPRGVVFVALVCDLGIICDIDILGSDCVAKGATGPPPITFEYSPGTSPGTLRVTDVQKGRLGCVSDKLLTFPITSGLYMVTPDGRASRLEPLSSVARANMSRGPDWLAGLVRMAVLLTLDAMVSWRSPRLSNGCGSKAEADSCGGDCGAEPRSR